MKEMNKLIPHKTVNHFAHNILNYYERQVH